MGDAVEGGLVGPVLSRFGALLGPSGFLGALAYYFGWARTQSLYRTLGVDSSMLGFGTADLVIRSLDTLLGQLPQVLLVLGAFVALHALSIFALVKRPCQRTRLRAAGTAGAAGIAVLPSVALWSRIVDPSRGALFAAAISWLLTLIAVRVLWLQIDGLHKDPGPLPRRGSDTPTPASLDQRVGAVLAATVLLTGTTFTAFSWVHDAAEREGRRAAVEAARQPWMFPCVSILTTATLEGLGAGPDLSRPTTSGEGLHLYQGLRLFVASGGRLFLFPAERSPLLGLLVLDGESVLALHTADDHDLLAPFDCADADTNRQTPP